MVGAKLGSTAIDGQSAKAAVAGTTYRKNETPQEGHVCLLAFLWYFASSVLRYFYPSLPLPMPTYVYEILDKKGQPTGETFEVVQSMKEDALTKQPGTDKPCRRAVVAPNIAGKWSDMKGKSQLSNANLERMGFTKYERKGKGYMERVAGKQGPKSISADD